LIRFRPLPVETVAELLSALGIVAEPERAAQLAAHSEGSLTRAAELADAELWGFRRQLFAQLAAPVLESVRLARAVAAFVETAGKELAPRRERLRQIAVFAADFYRQLLRALAGDSAQLDAEMHETVVAATAHWSGREDTAAACLDRCLEAIEQVDRNAYQPTLIEAWFDRLAALSTPVRG
jgi:DNA polymerase-3 subunit delta'